MRGAAVSFLTRLGPSARRHQAGCRSQLRNDELGTVGDSMQGAQAFFSRERTHEGLRLQSRMARTMMASFPTV